MPSSLTGHGVSKSGSPTPNDIASGISLTISKNFLIPDGSMLRILSESGFLMVSPTFFRLFVLHQGLCRNPYIF